MASVMSIGGGLVGPKTENVGFSLVLIVFLKGGGAKNPFASGGWGVPGERFREGKPLFRR